MLGDVQQVGPEAPGKEPAAQVRFLNEAELRALIPGKVVARSELGKKDNLPETFARDGTFTRYGGRVVVTGRYSISGDRVCIDTRAPWEDCRRVSKVAGDEYDFYAEPTPHFGARSWRVTILPQNDDGAR